MVNKTRTKNFNYKAWASELKKDFFLNTMEHDDYKSKLQKLERWVIEVQKINLMMSDKLVQTKADQLINDLYSSNEYEFLRTMVKKKLPKRGRREPWTKHLELVVYAIEKVGFQKEGLFRLRSILQIEERIDIPPENESLHSWKKTLTKNQQLRLPHFRSVHRLNTKSAGTQWAHEMKNAYIIHLDKHYKKISSEYKKMGKDFSVAKEAIPGFVLTKYDNYFSTLEKNGALD